MKGLAPVKMKIPEEHRKLLRQKLDVDASGDSLASLEAEDIEKFGAWLRGLESGKIQPYTENQKRFIEACEGKRIPTLPLEILWIKYRQVLKEAQRIKRSVCEMCSRKSTGSTWSEYVARYDGESRCKVCGRNYRKIPTYK